MPKLDGTGPTGQGSMTGRGMGRCGSGAGRGWNCQGMGRGLGRRFISPKNELSSLEEEEKYLEDQLAIIREEKKSLMEDSGK